MRKLFMVLLVGAVWLGTASGAIASQLPNQSTHLVPCNQSEAFIDRMKAAPPTYYFDTPYQSYSANSLCGAEGLPHLQLRFDRAVDIAIPFAIFFYVTGFIGWSGRAYLIGSKDDKNSEEAEIFINLALAARSFLQGLFWPLAAIKELTSGELTVDKSEISVSPR